MFFCRPIKHNLSLYLSIKGGVFLLFANVNRLKKYYSDRLVLDIEKFEILENQRIGLVGSNGAGKTTLIKALIGEIFIDEGDIYLTDSYSYISQSDDLKDSINKNLSGGEKVKLRIKNAMKENRKLIIADEPTSNLDKESIEALESMLKSHKGAMLIVSHDRNFLDSLCNMIAEMEDGKIKLYNGNYTTYLALKEEERKRAKFEYEQYTSEKKRLENVIVEKGRARDSIKTTPKRMGNSEARLHKMGGQKARKTLENSMKSVQKRIEKLDIKEKPKDIEKIKIYIQDSMSIAGKNLIEVSDLNLTVPEKVLLSNASFKIKRNKKVALIGSNGCGKTTLIKEIIKNNNASIKIHPKVKIGYFDQSQDILDESKSILENIRDVSSFDETFIRINLNLFGFKGDDVYKKVEVLSGGEKIRVAICRIILEDNNLLVLDEPTNYLDINSINSLEMALKETEKTMIIVSHDRGFIENVCDTIIEIKDKQIKSFSGSYNDFQEEKNKKNVDKYEKQKNDEILVLQNKLSSIISTICIENNLDKKKKLEQEYDELLRKLKLLK